MGFFIGLVGFEFISNWIHCLYLKFEQRQEFGSNGDGNIIQGALNAIGNFILEAKIMLIKGLLLLKHWNTYT